MAVVRRGAVQNTWLFRARGRVTGITVMIAAALVAGGCAPTPQPEVWSVSTLAGVAGVPGRADGDVAGAGVAYPHAGAVSASGDIYLADEQNHTIRQVSKTGVSTTLAGIAGATGSSDGPGASAMFNHPAGVALGPTGDLYVADAANHTIRRVAPDGRVSTFAGSPGIAGVVDGAGSAARFNKPDAVAVDVAGNVFVADTYNHAIRRITPGGEVATVAGVVGEPGSSDGSGASARFRFPRGVAVGVSGDVIVADSYNSTIRRIAPTGDVTTIAGSAESIGNVDGVGVDARFNQPFGVAVQGQRIWVADTFNHSVRRIDASGSVTTIAGSALSPGSDDGPGAAARFDRPFAIAIASDSKVIVTDTYNHTVRAIVRQ